jgi:hypothetical protein
MRLTVVRDIVRVQSRLKSLYRSRGIPVSGGRFGGLRHFNVKSPGGITTPGPRLTTQGAKEPR